MRLRSQLVAISGLLALLGAPAWAEAPFCFWDTDARSFDGNGDLSTYHIVPYPNDFVASTSSFFDDTNPALRGTEIWGVLHHCTSDSHLSFRVNEDDEGSATVQHFFALLDASEKITMNELADILQGRGAEVWQGKGGIGNCDCEIADLIKTSE